MAHVCEVMGEDRLQGMSRHALANEGHCALDAPTEEVASLVFEQVYLLGLSKLAHKKGDYWGGHLAVPAASCGWERAAQLVSPTAVEALKREGLAVIDGALSTEESAAACDALAALDALGALSVVESQSRAGLRNDRIIWVGAHILSDAPGLAVPRCGCCKRSPPRSKSGLAHSCLCRR